MFVTARSRSLAIPLDRIMQLHQRLLPGDLLVAGVLDKLQVRKIDTLSANLAEAMLVGQCNSPPWFAKEDVLISVRVKRRIEINKIDGARWDAATKAGMLV